MPTPRCLTFDTAAVYRIGVQGFLDKSWSDRMNGVDIPRGTDRMARR